MAVSEILTYTPIPTGEYTVRVTDVELTDSKYRNPDDGTLKKQVQVTVDVLGTDGRQKKFWCNWPPYKKSQIVKYAKAFGLDCEGNLNTDDLIGLEATAVIIAYTKDDGDEADRIEEIKPLKKQAGPSQKPAPASPPPPAPAAEIEDPFAEEDPGAAALSAAVTKAKEAVPSDVPSDNADAVNVIVAAEAVGLTKGGLKIWLSDIYSVEKTQFLPKSAIPVVIAYLENDLRAIDVKAFNDRAQRAKEEAAGGATEE
jgi:hypothetical protein